MRKIKFRGKKADGEWVYGSLVTDKYQRSDGTEFDVAFIADLPCMESANDMWTARMHRVEPETVCQFTGVTDKDGNDIYEGDVLLLQSKRRKPDEDPYQRQTSMVFYSNGSFSLEMADGNNMSIKRAARDYEVEVVAHELNGLNDPRKSVESV